VEADFGFRWRWRRLKQRAELLKDASQRAVVKEQSFVDFGQALKNGDVGGEVFAHFYERADDVETHGYGAGSVQNRGGHQCAVLGEGAHLFGKLQLLQGCHSL